jgi:malonyl CoA-acyl carrier protein transacylase
MGKALAAAFPEARAVFDEVDTALGEALSRLIFDGPEAELTLTANAQPALMAVSLDWILPAIYSLSRVTRSVNIRRSPPPEL